MRNRNTTPLLYVAIGNSLTAGIGSGNSPGFVHRYQCLAENILYRNVCPQIYFVQRDERILAEALERFRINVFLMIHEIRKIKSNSPYPYIIRFVDLYNPLPHVLIADKWVRLFNLHLRSFTSRNIAVTNVYAQFKGREKELLASDQFHPNARGYQVIAEQLNRLGYYPL